LTWYRLGGSDDRKASVLQSRSRKDFRKVAPHAIDPVHYSLLARTGIDSFFAPEFRRIQNELPEGMAVPEDKLFYATPLFDFGRGYVPAEIGNGFITERD
jgi:hypothetical protein